MRGIQKVGKIVWSVDAFQKSDAGLKSAARHVAALAEFFGATVTACYACPEPDVAMDAKALATLEAPYLREAEKRLERIAKLVPRCRPNLLAGGRGKADDVALVLKHAQKIGAGLIAVDSRGHGALHDYVLGSFTESLLAASTLPVAVIGPHHKASPRHRFRSFLFPTVFSSGDEAVFRDLLPVIKRKRGAVFVTHSVIETLLPVIAASAQIGGGFIPLESSYFESTGRRAHEHLARWLSLAHKAKVPVGGAINESEDAVASVLAASKKCDLIVMTSRMGKPGHRHLSAVARKIIRLSPVPVIAIKR